ncbi:hypothetical protein [Oceanobacillus sp. CFH 90083]|uniref:hypothetical protein n=1 Tax=Oceanobacillus sp. CFH 90083 TaxID=2592336 RepID=UPI001D15362F|nr:hypothetical protein [Oceanobacillus sp. CFH 90083]
MTFQPDKSGINSLAGFAYQIKVFAYYTFDLKPDTQVEFETIEDVNLKAIAPDQIDKHSDKFVCKVSDEGINKAIQVKHTSISNAVAQQMLLNWILLENSPHKVGKYILFTDKNYQNDGNIFEKDAEALYKIVVESDKQKNATISKVKDLYGADYIGFEKVYSQIQSKFEFIDLEDIDVKTNDKASLYFRKVANLIVFGQRLKEFLQHITIKILSALENGGAYILTYQEFISVIEDITSRFTPEITLPSYSNFKRINRIDLKDSKLSTSREYLQLKSCGLTDNLIKKHLLYGMYYYETSLKYMENNRASKIDEIEDTTFEGFEDVKFSLASKGIDTPYNRLEETKKNPNSYAVNNQIKYGSSIYLTKEDVGENQISWEDDENA